MSYFDEKEGIILTPEEQKNMSGREKPGWKSEEEFIEWLLKN